METMYCNCVGFPVKVLGLFGKGGSLEYSKP